MKLVSDEEEDKLYAKNWRRLDAIILGLLPSHYAGRSDIAGEMAYGEITDKEHCEIIVRKRMEFARGESDYRTMAYLFHSLSRPSWYKSNSRLRIDVIDFLLENFTRERLWDHKLISEGTVRRSKDGTWGFIEDCDDSIREVICMSLDAIFQPSQKKHKERFVEIERLVLDDSWGPARDYLIPSYARVGKANAVPHLIRFVKEPSLMQTAMHELGRLGAVEAIPVLEAVVANKNSEFFEDEGGHRFFRDIARTALRKIRKKAEKISETNKWS